MIYKRIQPGIPVRDYIKEYMLVHLIFDLKDASPVKIYPTNPEEGISFRIRGTLTAENPELNRLERRAQTYIFGQPDGRQNYHTSHDFMLAHVRFHPGSLYRLLRIPMNELVNQNIDAHLIMGNEIHEVEDRLACAVSYDEIPKILDAYFTQKINRLYKRIEPVDRIGRLIMADPQGFNLKKTANAACLSNRQFERRFMLQVGVTPKYFARICRFYQAYLLYEEQPQLGWYHIALQSGYTDYQHLAKDFKHFSGTTPTQLLLQCSNNPEERLKINTNVKGV